MDGIMIGIGGIVVMGLIWVRKKLKGSCKYCGSSFRFHRGSDRGEPKIVTGGVSVLCSVGGTCFAPDCSHYGEFQEHRVYRKTIPSQPFTRKHGISGFFQWLRFREFV